MIIKYIVSIYVDETYNGISHCAERAKEALEDCKLGDFSMTITKVEVVK